MRCWLSLEKGALPGQDGGVGFSVAQDGVVLLGEFFEEDLPWNPSSMSAAILRGKTCG